MKLAKWLHIGTDEYSIQVCVQGEKDNRYIKKTYTTYGKCNSDVTAYGTVEVAQKIQSMPQGIQYVEEVMKLDDLNIPVVQANLS